MAVFACVLSASAQWDAPASELARRIAPLAGSGTAALSVQNISSLPADQVAAVRKTIEAQLRAAGVQVKTSGPAANAIRVTLSENSRAWVWITEIQQGAEVKYSVLEVPRVENHLAPQTHSTVTISKKLLISRAEPMLDVAAMRNGSESQLWILGENTVELMRSVSGKWESVQKFAITRSDALPRDLRGKIALGSDHPFDVYLPGLTCAASTSIPPIMTCRESDDPWPLTPQKAFFNSARNYFTGVLPGIPTKLPPFYSLSVLPRGTTIILILTGLDGQVQMLDGANILPLPGTRDWGSDIAAVRSGCGAGTQVLASTAGDDAATDTLRAFEIGERGASLVSAPSTFDGPIMALWSTVDGNAAVAIVHNLQTGQYEAYNVAVDCNQ